MSNTRVFLAIFLVRGLYSGMQIISKIAFNGGMKPSVFVFYRQALATILLMPFALTLERNRAPPLPFKLCCKIFIIALFGVTATLYTLNIALEYTSPTLSSALLNSIPVITFLMAVLLRMETVRLERLSGIMKVSGVALCVAGIATIAFYKGPYLKSLNHHQLFQHGSGHGDQTRAHSRKTWVLGTFIMLLSSTTWSLWLILQGPLLDEYPSKLRLTTLMALFSTVQSFLVALAVERDFSAWKLGIDASLLSVAYCGVLISGVSFYLQSWCIEQRGAVFYSMWSPLTLVITIACSSFILGESINLESVLGGALMVGGLYSVLWTKSKEQKANKLPVVEEGNL